jgi:superfamily I DNA/RNA helicase
LFNNADIGKLTTATNLIQLYFQGTQPLGQILSNLIDSIENLVQSSLNGVTFDQFRQSVKQILDDRQALQKTLNRVLREFGTEIDEQDLQKLLQRSSTILNELNNLNPTGFEDLSPLVQEFIAHLKKAQELFKKFNRQDEDLTGNEPDEIKQLIINWGDAIRQIEKIEQTDPEIKNELNNDVSKNREAIAQSIKIHELLEQNYDYLTTLVRSGDLESAGIL